MRPTRISSLLIEISASTEAEPLALASEDFVARSFFLLASDRHRKTHCDQQSAIKFCKNLF